MGRSPKAPGSGDAATSAAIWSETWRSGAERGGPAVRDAAMTPAARLSAAIEVLDDVATRRRPVADSLKDWGLAHRFAGSGDRAGIAGLVYDALRRKASAGWVMGGETGRAVLLGSLQLQRNMDAEAIASLCSGERFAPPPLTAEERGRLAGTALDGAPLHVRADMPEWIVPSAQLTFGDSTQAEGEALARRAPLDLRVNGLKAERDPVRAELAHLAPVATPWSPWGLRVEPTSDGRPPPVTSDPAYLDGRFEIQDEGSQLATLLSGARPGEAVLDLCAGGGGKTLALAAMQGGRGRIVATDGDPRRLAPIHERLRRAGIGHAEILTPRGRADPLAEVGAEFDLVLVDAPCTGSGTWRRNPDAKWRLRPGSLSGRIADQAAVLNRAAGLVRPGGRVVYVTCSVLPEENDGAVAAFLARAGHGFAPAAPEATLAQAAIAGLSNAVRTTRHGLQMSPLRTGTDGFYVATIIRGG